MQAPRYAKSLIAGGASAFLALGLASVGLAEGASAPSTLRESFTSKTAAQQKFFGTAETVKVERGGSQIDDDQAALDAGVQEDRGVAQDAPR